MSPVRGGWFGLMLAMLSAGSAKAQAPFAVGETLEYGASYKVILVSLSVGKAATFAVEKVDTIAGVPSWVFSSRTDVSSVFFHNHTELRSWTGVDDFVSRRYVHKIDETNYRRDDDYRIHPDSGFYRNMTNLDRQATSAQPLDDVALFYYLRLPSVPLAVGTTYTLPRYFKSDRNPLTIAVVRRDNCELPDHVKLQCLVLNPVLEDPPHGMLMRKEHAELWLTDDARRIPVRIKSGATTLTLRRYRAGGSR